MTPLFWAGFVRLIHNAPKHLQWCHSQTAPLRIIPGSEIGLRTDCQIWVDHQSRRNSTQFLRPNPFAGKNRWVKFFFARPDQHLQTFLSTFCTTVEGAQMIQARRYKTRTPYNRQAGMAQHVDQARDLRKMLRHYAPPVLRSCFRNQF